MSKPQKRPEATFDDFGRKRVAPNDTRPWAERFVDRFVWPGRHGKWWNFNTAESRTKTAVELFEGLHNRDIEEARATLAHIESIAQGAVDRAAAADRRATTIAGTVAIAASLTLSGGGLALDAQKITDPDARRWFGIVLCVATACFVLSAFYALRALVATRTWNWGQPTDLPIEAEEHLQKRLGMQAAHLLQDYAGNWEISDVKNRLVDLSLRWLVGALFSLLGLAVLVASQIP